MTGTSDDEQQIRSLIESWARAVEKRDLDGILAEHGDDVLMFDVPAVELRGISDYRRSWQQMFPWLGESGRFQLDGLAVTAGGDVAFATAIVHCAGETLQQRGAELTVRLTVGLRKLDGRWTVLHEHHSVASDG